jgi:hypothetical protein
VKFASAIRWTGSSAPRSRLLAPFFALRWIPAAAAAPSRRTRLRRTAFACARTLAKASNLPRSHLRLPAHALVAPRTSPPKSLPSRANAPSLAARRGNLPRLHPSRTIVPNRAASPTSLPSRLSLILDALTLAAPRLSVSKNPHPRSAAPDLVAPGASVSTTMIPRASLRTHAIRRSSPLLNLRLVGVQDLVAEQPRLRLSKRPSMPLALVLTASHPSKISSRLQRLVVRTLAARKSDRSALRALAPMPAAPLLRLITGWRLRRPRFRPSPT